MFSYYGSKSKIVKYYPPPKHDLIIEPFAGSARYALEYFEHDIIINDKYEIVARIWKFLQQCSPADIKSLPNLKHGDKIHRDEFDCIEMAWLMGYMINSGVATPMLTMSHWGEKNYYRSKEIIINNLFKIKHWKVLNSDYTELDNVKATWFIDPPYIDAGYKYKESSKKINFSELASWCKTRNGQTVVCESANAKWLPFLPMKKMNGIKGESKLEAIWSNEITNYDNIQTHLILE